MKVFVLFTQLVGLFFVGHLPSIYGLGFQDEGLGLRASSLRFRVQGVPAQPLTVEGLGPTIDS